MIRLLVALALAVMAGPVAAAQCGARDSVLAQLGERYGESRQGAGLAANGALLEVFAGASGSWTITVTTADQKTCLVASGQGWEDYDTPPPPQGTPG